MHYLYLFFVVTTQTIWNLARVGVFTKLKKNIIYF